MRLAKPQRFAGTRHVCTTTMPAPHRHSQETTPPVGWCRADQPRAVGEAAAVCRNQARLHHHNASRAPPAQPRDNSPPVGWCRADQPRAVGEAAAVYRNQVRLHHHNASTAPPAQPRDNATVVGAPPPGRQRRPTEAPQRPTRTRRTQAGWRPGRRQAHKGRDRRPVGLQLRRYSVILACRAAASFASIASLLKSRISAATGVSLSKRTTRRSICPRRIVSSWRTTKERSFHTRGSRSPGYAARIAANGASAPAVAFRYAERLRTARIVGNARARRNCAMTAPKSTSGSRSAWRRSLSAGRPARPRRARRSARSICAPPCPSRKPRFCRSEAQRCQVDPRTTLQFRGAAGFESAPGTGPRGANSTTSGSSRAAACGRRSTARS